MMRMRKKMKEKTEKVTELEEGEDVLRREKQRREERGRSSFISMASLSLSLDFSSPPLRKVLLMYRWWQRKLGRMVNDLFNFGGRLEEGGSAWTTMAPNLP